LITWTGSGQQMQFGQLKRRAFITLLGGAAAWPLAARAQQAHVPVVGFLSGASSWEYAPIVDAFRAGLKAAGYVEGQNVAVEYRWAEGHYDRLPTLAAELLSHRVAVMVVNGPAALPAQSLTTSIPIIFVTAVDPVATGLVASLNRPGGNLTGVTALSVELAPKKLQMLHEVIPDAKDVGLLLNPANRNADSQLTKTDEAAKTLGLRLHVLYAKTERDLDSAFSESVRLQLGALVIGTDGFFNSQSQQLAALALRHSLPAVFQYRAFTAAGGLMSYGTSLTGTYYQAAGYVARVLTGVQPADLPVQQATTVELIINLKTAKTLGLDVPPTLLGRADDVIE
jgi:putative tryptophan/tyrosine transport system substrate-binding protein